MKILISGGSGMIGGEITQQLLLKGHEVCYLSRNPDHKRSVQEFFWDPDRGVMDDNALDGVDGIVNLAGAPLNRRWTPAYKSLILRSRIDSSRLLFNAVQKNSSSVKCMISVSASGYYPNDLQRTFNESDPPGNDFLSLVCQKWEQEAQNFELLGIRTVRCRVGLVISRNGGALKPIAQTVKWGIGAPLGSGKQWMPWIHISDVAGIFVKAVEDTNLQGVYNTCGPYSVTNKEFTQEVANILKRPLMLPNVPAGALKILLGEMADMPLSSNRMSSEKIIEAGYTFQYNKLEEALRAELK